MACSRVLDFNASAVTLAGTEEQSPLQIWNPDHSDAMVVVSSVPSMLPCYCSGFRLRYDLYGSKVAAGKQQPIGRGTELINGTGCE